MKQIKFRLLNRFLVLLPILLLSVDAFARAGGGGGKGGGKGSLFGLIIWGIYTLIITIILYIKVDHSRDIIGKSSTKDSFWDFNQMRDNAKRVFFKMQHAWMNRNMDSVRDLVTPELYDDYKNQLDLMKLNGEKNILSGIEVKNVRIIGCEDYLDDKQDSYIAHITGEMLDYTIDERTNEVTKNPDKKMEKFTDTYHFIRSGNKWLLEYIDNNVSMWDVIKTKNYHEVDKKKNTVANN